MENYTLDSNICEKDKLILYIDELKMKYEG
jgi:hypothetical protein